MPLPTNRNFYNIENKIVSGNVYMVELGESGKNYRSTLGGWGRGGRGEGKGRMVLKYVKHSTYQGIYFTGIFID